MLNRRVFLSTLAAGFALDPERILWRPGAKHISIPKPQEGKVIQISFDGGVDPWHPVVFLKLKGDGWVEINKEDQIKAGDVICSSQLDLMRGIKYHYAAHGSVFCAL